MAKQPQILSPREPLTDGQNNVTRSWFRFFNSLSGATGTVATPLVVKANAILNDATVSSGGTISSPDLPPSTLLGNGGAAAAQPGTVDVGLSLSLSGGTLDAAPLPPGTLSGNPGSEAAPPVAVTPGSGLALSAAGVLTATGNSDDEVAIYSLRDTRGEIASLERKVNDALILALLPPPQEVSGSAAGVIEVVIASSVFLNAGTILTTGTISSPTLAATGLLGGTIGSHATNIPVGAGLALLGGTLELGTIAAGELLGNFGTVAGVPAGVAIGAGLTLSAGGTLAAIGGGTVSVGAVSLFGNPGSVTAAGTTIALGPSFSFAGNTLEFTGTITPSSQILTVPFPMIGTVAGGQQMNITFTQAGTLLANGGAFEAFVGTNPTATEHLTLNTIHSGALTTRGTISISTAGSVTPPTFAAVPIVAGDTAQILNQSTSDTTFANTCLSLQFMLASGSVGQLRTVPFPMVGTVAGGQEMNITFTQAGTLLANGGTPQAFVGANPTATEHLTLNTIHSGTLITQGTVTISTAGAVTFPTFAAVAIAAGDTAQILNQSTADTTFANTCLSLQYQVT
jgi:hypothetical protein